MTKERQLAEFDSLMKEIRSLLDKKGDDYSHKDRLSNFKTAGNICQIKPEQHCLALIATKVARLGALIASDKEPNNESIDDSIQDLITYGFLLHLVVNEESIEQFPIDELDIDQDNEGNYFVRKDVAAVETLHTDTPKFICPQCGSIKNEVDSLNGYYNRKCLDCKHQFHV